MFNALFCKPVFPLYCNKLPCALGMHRILILPDILPIEKPDTGYLELPGMGYRTRLLFLPKTKNTNLLFPQTLIFLAIDKVCTFAFSSRRKFLASVYQDLCGCIRPEIRPFRQTDIRLVWYIQYSDGY